MENNTTGLADRFNEGKIKWSLVDFKSLEPMVQVLMYGANKYSKDNWKKGLPITEIFDSLQRHLNSFMSGEDVDVESGLSHLGHAQCNLMFLIHMLNNKPELDDRFKSLETKEPKHITITDSKTTGRIHVQNNY